MIVVCATRARSQSQRRVKKGQSTGSTEGATPREPRDGQMACEQRSVKSSNADGNHKND